MVTRNLRLDDFIPYRLSFTATSVSESIADIYERLFGINVPEWRVIAWVSEAGEAGITQQDIGARTRMDKVTVSRATIALTKRGLLLRTAHPGDGRSQLLMLSAEGKALHGEIAPKALELEAKILEGFDPQEVERFVGMLRRIDAAVFALQRPEG